MENKEELETFLMRIPSKEIKVKSTVDTMFEFAVLNANEFVVVPENMYTKIMFQNRILDLYKKYMQYSYIVELQFKEDLSQEDKQFIVEKIEELKRKYHIQQSGKLYYQESNRWAEDLHDCVCFFSALQEYKSYFTLMQYNSYVEGILHGGL